MAGVTDIRKKLFIKNIVLMVNTLESIDFNLTPYLFFPKILLIGILKKYIKFLFQESWGNQKKSWYAPVTHMYTIEVQENNEFYNRSYLKFARNDW